MWNNEFLLVQGTVDHQKFQKFDTVMWLYVNYKRTQKAETLTHQARNVSALQGRGGGRQGRGECGRGRQGGANACLKGIVPQEEVDKVTTVKARFYPYSKYSKFTLPRSRSIISL
jgi:hypothetical protein